MIDKMKLNQWVDELSENDQKTVLDFVEYLVNRNKEKVIREFYYSIPEVDEPLSNEEKRQIKGNNGYMEFEIIERDLSEEN